MKPFWEIITFLFAFKIFHLGRYPITMKPFWEFLAFLTTSKNVASGPMAHYNEIILRNLHHLDNFPPRQVAHYNKITLKNLRIFHLFEKSSCFSPEQVTHYNKTTLKNLRIFRHLENSFLFFLGRSSMTIRPFQNLWKTFLFFLLVCFLALTSNTFGRIHHFLIWRVHHLYFFFFFTKLTI